MDETSSHTCMWRDCTEVAHPHTNVKFKAFDAYLDFGGIWLCKSHCRIARRTGHMDIRISGIRMEMCERG